MFFEQIPFKMGKKLQQQKKRSFTQSRSCLQLSYFMFPNFFYFITHLNSSKNNDNISDRYRLYSLKTEAQYLSPGI